MTAWLVCVYMEIIKSFAIEICAALFKALCLSATKIDTARSGLTRISPVHGALQSSALHARALVQRGAALCAAEGF